MGHSMGCTQYLVMLSQRPEYNEKVRGQARTGQTMVDKLVEEEQIMVEDLVEEDQELVAKLYS